MITADRIFHPSRSSYASYGTVARIFHPSRASYTSNGYCCADFLPVMGIMRFEWLPLPGFFTRHGHHTLRMVTVARIFHPSRASYATYDYRSADILPVMDMIRHV